MSNTKDSVETSAATAPPSSGSVSSNSETGPLLGRDFGTHYTLKQCAVPINRTTLRRDQIVISRIHCILFLTPRFLSKYFRMGYLENGDDEESKVRQMASEAKLTLHSLLLYRPLALRFPVRIVQSYQRNARRKTNLSLSLSLSEGTKATTRRVGQKR